LALAAAQVRRSRLVRLPFNSDMTNVEELEEARAEANKITIIHYLKCANRMHEFVLESAGHPNPRLSKTLIRVIIQEQTGGNLAIYHIQSEAGEGPTHQERLMSDSNTIDPCI
jgi:hypothetical protein